MEGQCPLYGRARHGAGEPNSAAGASRSRALTLSWALLSSEEPRASVTRNERRSGAQVSLWTAAPFFGHQQPLEERHVALTPQADNPPTLSRTVPAARLRSPKWRRRSWEHDRLAAAQSPVGDGWARLGSARCALWWRWEVVHESCVPQLAICSRCSVGLGQRGRGWELRLLVRAWETLRPVGWGAPFVPLLPPPARRKPASATMQVC